jgi:membrane protein
VGHSVASDQTIDRFLRELLPAQTATDAVPLVRGILIDVEAKRSALGLIGAPLFIWFSTRFFGAIRGSLSSVFAVKRGHGIIRGKLLDMLYVIVGTLLVTVYLALNAYLGLATHLGSAIGHFFGLQPEFAGYVRRLVGRTVSTMFLAGMFTGIYKFIPNRPVAWKSAVWGGVWGALLFEVTRTLIFELAARSMSPASIYSGTLAGIVVIVFWAYYAAVIFLIGGVVARMHEVRGHRRTGASVTT